MSRFFKMEQFGPLLAWCIAAIGWGSAWFLNRVTFSEGGFTNYTAAALRFDLAAVLAVLFVVVFKGRGCYNRRLVRLNCLAAIPMAGFYVGIYVATQHILGGLAATIQSLSGVMMICLSVLLGLEKVPRASWLGAILSVLGTAVIFLNKASLSSEHGLAAQGTAVLIMVGAAASYALGTLVLRRKKSEDDPFASTSILLLAEGVLLTLIAWFVQDGEVLPAMETLRLEPVVGLLIQVAISTLGAFAACVYLSTRVSVSTMASLSFSTPLLAIVIDRFCEKPALWVVNYTWTTFLGAALVLIGLIPVVWKRIPVAGK